MSSRLLGEIIAALLSRTHGEYIELDATNDERMVNTNGWFLETQI